SPATGDHAAGAPAPATGPSTATGDATPATTGPSPATGDPTPHAAGHTTGPSPATAHHAAGAPGDPPAAESPPDPVTVGADPATSSLSSVGTYSRPTPHHLSRLQPPSAATETAPTTDREDDPNA
ncbi:MAG: hypothetical protein QOF20_819, partial [Acidimicrobiaceae bacterium]|nr:hypothetical protein [Acidimicrobiaceae bacterium]